MSLPRLIIVTRGAELDPVFEVLDAAGGSAIVCLRDKQAGADELFARARALAPRCWLSINVGGAAIDWRAAGARFVHLPEDAAAIEGLPHGRSVHSIEAARREAPAAAYLVAGPVWPTAGKPEPLGLEALGAICAAAGTTPVFAIGGILGVEQARAALAAGAYGVAGIRAFAGAAGMDLARSLAPSGIRS